MTRRSLLLSFGLPLSGFAALLGGSLTLAADRPIHRAEEPPRLPSSAPALPPSALALDDARAYLGSIGLLEPPGEPIAIAPHIAGIVEAVLVERGAAVVAGDPLFRIDARSTQREVEVRRSRLAVARAEVEALRGRIPSERARLAASEAALAAARANVEVATADAADRENRLRIALAVDDPRAIAREEVEARRFGAQSARAAVAAAETRVAEAEAARAEARAQLALLVANERGEDGPELLAAARRVDEAAAALAQAETELERLIVRAPCDAVVLQVNVRAGELAPTQNLTEPLLLLGRTGAPHLRCQIDEVDVPRFEREASAWAAPRGDASRRIALRCAYVEPLVVPKRNLAGKASELVDTRVLEAVYALPEGERGLPFGMQMDVYIEARADAGAGAR
ncbi:MAG: biotin/lipoyl-binding protein [Planctomycetes bacterium]|nr:biotin/lipoyl-binding protein [Planctomycetota bacterium]